MKHLQNCGLNILLRKPILAAIFSSFHSNRMVKIWNGAIFIFKSQKQCLLSNLSSFWALLKKIEFWPKDCLKGMVSRWTFFLATWKKIESENLINCINAENLKEIDRRVSFKKNLEVWLFSFFTSCKFAWFASFFVPFWKLVPTTKL